MDIYSPDPNDEIFIELRQWCLATPLDLSQLESDYVKELHPMFGQKHTDETRQLMSKSHSGENNHMYGKRGVDNPNYGRTREDLIIINKSRAGRTVSDDTKDKLREQRIGENNPMYGTIWINNSIINKKIRGDVPEGWVRGRLISNEYASKFTKRSRAGTNNTRFNKTVY